MCVCLYVCVYCRIVYALAYVCSSMFVFVCLLCLYVCSCLSVFVCIRSCMCGCLRVSVHLYLHVRIRPRVSVFACVCLGLLATGVTGDLYACEVM